MISLSLCSTSVLTFSNSRFPQKWFFDCKYFLTEVRTLIGEIGEKHFWRQFQPAPASDPHGFFHTCSCLHFVPNPASAPGLQRESGADLGWGGISGRQFICIAQPVDRVERNRKMEVDEDFLSSKLENMFFNKNTYKWCSQEL